MTKHSPKLRRTIGLAAIASTLGLATFLTLKALEDKVVYFYDPSQLKAQETPTPQNQTIRVGGLVVKNSVDKTANTIRFNLTDGTAQITVTYQGILPDLFREGQGIIAEGRYDGTNFLATTVLAKHDETYMPKEIADTLKNKGLWKPQE